MGMRHENGELSDSARICQYPSLQARLGSIFSPEGLGPQPILERAIHFYGVHPLASLRTLAAETPLKQRISGDGHGFVTLANRQTSI